MEHPSNPLLRQVASGWLEGIRSPEYSVLCWLGIPYAAPPVGPLRWRAPQDPIPWEGIRPAKQFGPVSVQKQGTAVVGSEDCLYLNVFRPDTQETLPVFFFIHGGNNQTDSGQLMDGHHQPAAGRPGLAEHQGHPHRRPLGRFRQLRPAGYQKKPLLGP